MAPSKRFQIAELGEYYDDCLSVEAAIKNRTKANEAASLLCSMLQSREEKRKQMVQYLASKYNIEYNDMWNRLLDGSFKPSEDDITE